MTSEEAKKKWCPMARVFRWKETVKYGTGVMCAAAINRYKNGKFAHCLAEDCMMWTGEDCGLKIHIEEKEN